MESAQMHLKNQLLSFPSFKTKLLEGLTYPNDMITSAESSSSGMQAINLISACIDHYSPHTPSTRARLLPTNPPECSLPNTRRSVYLRDFPPHEPTSLRTKSRRELMQFPGMQDAIKSLKAGRYGSRRGRLQT